jgi:hypothetical protein
MSNDPLNLLVGKLGGSWQADQQPVPDPESVAAAAG